MNLNNASNIVNTNSWPWKVFTGKQNITDASTFFIAIFKPGETSPRFTSGRFNILRASVASVTPRISSTSSVQTFSSSSSLVPTLSPSSLPNDSGSDSRTNSGLRRGPGFGLGLGIPFVLRLGIILGYFLRSNGKIAAGDVGDDDHTKPIGGDISTLPSPQQTQGPMPMHELWMTERSELDSQPLQELGPVIRPRWYGSCIPGQLLHVYSGAIYFHEKFSI